MAGRPNLSSMWLQIKDFQFRKRPDSGERRMSKLTNRNLWMAGAFNHKRQSVRRIQVSTTANWQGIVAKAKSVLLDGNCLILIIATAKPLTPEPSEHDVLNAQISSLVFRKQARFHDLPTMRTYLEDDSGVRFEIRQNLASLETQIRKTILNREQRKPLDTPIPSPLACFLLRGPVPKKN
jgi:hypothetical protein